MDRTTELSSGLQRLGIFSIKGNRARHTITFNPNKAKPGGEHYIDLPNLNSDLCLVAESAYLCFNFENANTKSWFKNKLGKRLQKKLVIKVSGQIIHENGCSSISSFIPLLEFTRRPRKHDMAIIDKYNDRSIEHRNYSNLIPVKRLVSKSKCNIKFGIWNAHSVNKKLCPICD